MSKTIKNMECGVNPQESGECEPHGRWINHLGDRERPHKTGSQLAGFHTQGKVLC